MFVEVAHVRKFKGINEKFINRRLPEKGHKFLLIL